MNYCLSLLNLKKMAHKSGFVAVVGFPNAGKSTLLNKLVGQEVAIVSPKPQTTRLRTRGVYNSQAGQIVFVDTPGFYQPFDKLGEYLVNSTKNALKDCDVLLFVLDVSSYLKGKKENLYGELGSLIKKAKCPKVIFLNKVDLLKEKEVLALIDEVNSWGFFDKVLSGSALYGVGLNELVEEIFNFLPEGPPYYPPEMLTDQPIETRVSEMIRAKVFQFTKKEIPYGVAVRVKDWIENKDKSLVEIKAALYVERDSQKGIVIGQGGKKLKEIGTLARKEIEAILGRKVYLELRVRVKRKWRKDERFFELLYQ